MFFTSLIELPDKILVVSGLDLCRAKFIFQYDDKVSMAFIEDKNLIRCNRRFFTNE